MILSVDEGKAYIQNADTNAYLEGKIEAAQTAANAAASAAAAAQSAAANHTHTPASIGAAPAYTYSTTDLTAGSSALETGKMYLVYE